MKIHTFIVLLSVYLTAIFSSYAQTVIKIPYRQHEIFVVQPATVTKDLGHGGSVELGFEADIHGGSGNYTFQWFKEGAEVGSQPSFVATESGTYILIVNDGAGCESGITYTVSGGSGLDNLYEESIRIYPNPNQGDFFISANLNQTIDKVEIIGMDGKTHPISAIRREETNIHIQASDLPAGYYFLTSYAGNQKITKVLLINP